MKLQDLKRITEQFRNSHTGMDPQKQREVLQEMGIEPSSFYQELEMTSRFVDTHQDVSDSNANVSLHSHAFYELLYCRSGEGVEYLLGSERYRLEQGDIVLVAPGISHRPILPEQMEVPYMRDVLWISSEFMNTLQAQFPGDVDIQKDFKALVRTAGTQWESIGKLFRNGVMEAEKAEPGWELAVVGNTMTILSQLKRAFMERSMGELKREKRELLDEIAEYIEHNYTKHMTLGDVSRQFYVSESTVSHLFKKKMGVSLYHYVTQRRLIAAKNQILEGLPLEVVAEQVGFSDYSSFYRAFKGEYGISPRQFRIQSGIKE